MSSNPNENHEPELVPEDDAIIGTALKGSALAVLAIAVVGAGIWYVTRPAEEPEEVLEKVVGEIVDLVSDEAQLPEVTFTDITAEAGIDFVHFSGATGDKLLPETMGGGAAFFDYDNDGDQDLYFVNGAPWVHDDPESGGAGGPGNRLYANDGAGNFADVTDAAGLRGGRYGMGVAVGDVDGNGWTDVFTTGIAGNALYLNDGGVFTEAAEAAGVAGTPGQWTTSAGFFDHDRDGDLDLFVCNYVTWSREIDEQLAYTLNGEDRSYGPPTNYAGTTSFLFENDGSGRFTDVSEAAGIKIMNPATGDPMGKALALAFIDYDRDGWLDVFVANDTVANFLFRNNGNGRFDEVATKSGVAYDSSGAATGAMGIDVADYRADGSLGIGIGNFANEMSSLFVADAGRTRFSDDAIGEGVGSPSRQKLSFGLFFFDYDLDGRQDLLQVNGHLDDAINQVQPSQHYLQSPQLFWNAGPDSRSAFMVVPPETAGDLDTELAGRGSAYADIDGDGDLDVVLCQVGAPPLLLRNDLAGDSRHLRVELEDPSRPGGVIGAWVTLRTEGAAQRRLVTPTKSYLSQSELPVTFGLGPDATLADVQALEVTWPDGVVQDVPLPDALDRTVRVVRE